MRSIRTGMLALTGIGLAAAATASAQTADVQIIHNAPDPLAASVDIYVDGALALDDFGYLEATPVIPLPAGTEIEIGVAGGDSDGPKDILASFPVTLLSGGSYVVMAAGVLDGTLPGNPDGIDTAFSLYPKPGLRTSSSGGNVDILAFHGSPNAPTVDIVARDVATLFPGLAFTDYSMDYGTVPEGAYILDITPAGDPETVVISFEANLVGLGGGAGVAFASGFLGDDPTDFGLNVALPDGTVVQLPLFHGSTPTAEKSWTAIKGMYSN